MGNGDKGVEQESVTASACDQCRSRKVRCDRKSPDCSNCTKAGVSCAFSNKARRINHTKQLVNDFTGWTIRLETIDDSIAKLSRQVTALRADSATRSEAPSEFEDLESVHAQLNTSPDLKTSEAGRSNRTNGVHCAEGTQDGEHFYGFTAPITLFRCSRQLLSDVLASVSKGEIPDDASKNSKNTIGDGRGETCEFAASDLVAGDEPLGAALQLQYEAFPFQGVSREPDFNGDGKSIARPPLPLLEASIDCFFKEINSSVPVFRETRLRAAVEEQYFGGAASAAADMSWSLCFNNIILLTLGLKSRLARFGRSHIDGMDDDLLISFLNNARRAFQIQEYFSKPRLVNAQALITLAMVAREYFEGQVFDRLCQMACQLIRLMGLQQSHSGPSDLDTERKNIFWALYVMDKQRLYMNGRPCDLYLFDSDIQLPARDDASAVQSYNLAHIHMMTLWEEVYMSLYSSRALRKGDVQRQEQVCRLKGLICRWTAQHNDLINRPEGDDSSATTILRLELMYCFHVVQILMYRYRGQDDSSKQQWRNSAQAALKILSSLRLAVPSLGRAALLGRLFRNYPMVAFHDIHDLFITAPDMSLISDVALLVDTAEILSTLKHPAFPQVYYTRLHLGMIWSIENVHAIKNALESGASPTADEQSGPNAQPERSQGLAMPVAPCKDTLNFLSSNSVISSPPKKRRLASPAILQFEEDGALEKQPDRLNARTNAPRSSDIGRFFKPQTGNPAATAQCRQPLSSNEDTTFASFLMPSTSSIPINSMSSFGGSPPQSAQHLGSNLQPYGPISYASGPALGTSSGPLQFESNPSIGSAMLESWDVNDNDQVILDNLFFHSSI